jgi:hypothetical protein
VAQSSSSDVDRTRGEAAALRRANAADAQAEKAAGIGETDGEDHETEERDADGRRLWEFGPGKPPVQAKQEESLEDRQSRDASGESGGQLDLTG